MWGGSTPEVSDARESDGLRAHDGSRPVLEAIRVTPTVYFPEVLELARQLINTSVRQLEYEEIRRLLHRSMCSAH